MAPIATGAEQDARTMNGVLWRVVRVRFREGGAKEWTEKFSFGFDSSFKFESCLVNQDKFWRLKS